MRTWVIEWLWGIFSPQLINVKTRALICLQDTAPALDPINPCLPTIWGIVGGLAWAEPGYQIHHFVVIAQSSTYPPTQETEERSLISIPTFYLDPDRSHITLSPPLDSVTFLVPTFGHACCTRRRGKLMRLLRRESLG
jgi:hypothetical protein